MTAQEKYEYWLDTAQYDLACADSMYGTGRWLYVAFMCQQAIEKLVKGLYVLYVGDDVPRTHNIRVVIEKYENLLLQEITEKHYTLFETLTIHYLDGRYTDYKQKLSERLGEPVAADLLKQTKEVFSWLLTLKP
jgi:HEPN domain-containing protein